MQTQSQQFEVNIKKALPYLTYLPDDYTTSDKSYPLILFLHGMGERGDDIEAIKTEGLTKKLESGDNVPFIVIAPQCPLNTKWEVHLDVLRLLIDEICNTHRVDASRIYCTGLSMGGSGTWSLATTYPDLFAAILPICGRERNELDFPERLKKIVHLPVWCFHGDADPVVPLESSIYLSENLKAYGGNPILTIYEGIDHDSWTQTYANPEIYNWLLSHQRDVEQ